MPNVDKQCVTHHYACDCREAAMRNLVTAYRRIALRLQKGLPCAELWLHVERFESQLNYNSMSFLKEERFKR